VSDIQLFRTSGGNAVRLVSRQSDLEKALQTFIESNMVELLGVRFLATEYSTGKTHGGRIDSLGIDEDNSPVIIEYKRSTGENVINQGLFYLNWLMDHKAEFELLVLKRMGGEVAELIDWSAPRLICIAGDFTRYDSHAVEQMDRNIELLRYRQFGDELLLFELVNSPNASSSRASSPRGGKSSAHATPAEKSALAESRAAAPRKDRTYAEWQTLLSPDLKALLDSIEEYIVSLGDDVQRRELKLYVAFKRLKNFASIVPQKAKLLLFLHINPDLAQPLPPNARDGRTFGHWGTGDLELSIASGAEFEASKPLISLAYEGLSR
jgi:predicted transport protein